MSRLFVLALLLIPSLAFAQKPTREQIIAHMDGNICRCGTYTRIIAAIQRAAAEA